MMPNDGPRDGVFCPILTLVMDSTMSNYFMSISSEDSIVTPPWLYMKWGYLNLNYFLLGVCTGFSGWQDRTTETVSATHLHQI